MGFSMLRDMKNILNAFNKGGSLFGGINVTNIPIKEEGSYTAENLKKNFKNIQLMLKGHGASLKKNSRGNDIEKQFLSYYDELLGTYNGESKNIIDFAKKADEMKGDKEKYKESFNKLCLEIINTSKKISDIKNSMKEVADNSRKIENNIKEINETKKQIRSDMEFTEKRWKYGLKIFKNQFEKKYDNKYREDLNSMTTCLFEYVRERCPDENERGRMFKEILGRNYEGEWDEDEDGQKAKATYELLKRINNENSNKMFENWLEIRYPEEFLSLKKLEELENLRNFSEVSKVELKNLNIDGIGKFIDFHKQLVEGCRRKVEPLRRRVRDLDKDMSKYQNLLKENNESVFTNDIEKWNEKILQLQKEYSVCYNYLNNCMTIGSRVITSCSKILEKIDGFENNVVNRSKEDKKLFRGASSGEVNGNKISLIQVVGVLNYYIGGLVKKYKEKGEYYNRECKKLEENYKIINDKFLARS